MKKLFLTSGIIACMACPAFATVGDGAANIAANASSANCDSTTLETSTAGATSNFEAMWRNNVGTFSFDNNISWTNSCDSSISHNDASGNDEHLYSRYDEGVWTTSARTGDTATTMNVPSRTGYTFGGYYQESALANQVVTDAGAITNGVSLANLITADNGTATLYAKWTPETYTNGVTFSCGSVNTNGSATPVVVASQTGAITPLSPTYDDCFTLPAASECAAPAGYTFQGWECGTAITGLTENGNGTNVYDAEDGAVWTMDRSGQTAIQCVAKWGRNNIGLTYTVDGQSYSTQGMSTSCDYGTAIGVLPTDPSKTGYTFTGWDVTSVTNPQNP